MIPDGQDEPLVQRVCQRPRHGIERLEQSPARKDRGVERHHLLFAAEVMALHHQPTSRPAQQQQRAGDGGDDPPVGPELGARGAGPGPPQDQPGRQQQDYRPVLTAEQNSLSCP
jgi:hypothetical protein